MCLVCIDWEVCGICWTMTTTTMLLHSTLSRRVETSAERAADWDDPDAPPVRLLDAMTCKNQSAIQR